MSSKNTQKMANSQGQEGCFSGIFLIYKDRGDTLATLLDKFRIEHKLTPKDKLTYAGRLDPMAEGLVLVLAGQSRFEKDAMLGKDKVYEVEVILGIGTDTMDSLGVITETNLISFEDVEIQKQITKMLDITKLPYPMYSSVPVAGKPLFAHARSGTTVEIPMKNVKIYEANLLGIEKVKISDLIEEMIVSINKVQGDFRQGETVKKWEQFLSENLNQEVQIVKIRIKSSSGAYMRSLAEWLGNQLGSPALAYKIKRLEIGEYKT